MSNIKSRIEALKNQLEIWAEEYYVNDKPSVDDLQYDAVYNELLKLEQENPELITQDSITQKVGGRLSKKFEKVNHKFPMLSLSNAFGPEDLIKFNDQIKKELGLSSEIKYMVEQKIDGLSISLIYKNGILHQALTRGNGVQGEDVTENVMQIKDIPHKINYLNEVEFRGEIYMSKKVFEHLNAQGENFANPRNAAAGTLRQIDSSIVKSRNLSSIIYSIPNPLDHNLSTHEQVLKFIKDQGLATHKNAILSNNVEEVIKNVEQITLSRNDLDFEIDGIVIKVNDITTWEDIGYTAKAPKFMIAYKFPEELASTELLDIFPTIGRTGRVTYNAKLAPVRLGGSTVTAATLHNSDYIDGLKINIGDIVNVKKAGEIIPKVLSVKEKRNNDVWTKATHCPACSHQLINNDGEVDQYCINVDCPQKNIAKLEHFVARNAMNIEGFSSQTIHTFINEGLITDMASIFDIPNKTNEILMLPGFKQKSVDNLINSISKSKKIDLGKFIFALGIRHVGEKIAKTIAKRFGSIESIMNLDHEQIQAIRDLGPKVAESINNYFADEANKEQLKRLLSKGIVFEAIEKNVSDKLSGLTFVITGTLSKPRGNYKQMIELNGGNVTGTVTNKTSFLLAGKEAGSKLSKAEKLKVKIINENTFIQMLEGGE